MFIISILSEKPLAEHTLLRTSGTGNSNLGSLRGVLANNAGLAAAIPTWTSALIDRAPESAIQVLLARQLRRELGRDDPDLKHGVRVDWMLSVWKAVVDSVHPCGRDAVPGKGWLESSERCFSDLSFVAGVGALVAAKYRSEELSAWLDIMWRRRGDRADGQFAWLEQHANTQAEHAGEIENLLVITASEREREEMIRGAQAFDACLWKFLDDMQRRQYQRVAA
ncbi:MAG: hypothetical protein AAFX92_14535 [Pseudomonadota bacterium]